MALKAAPWGKLEQLALKTRWPRSRELKRLTATQQRDHRSKLQLGPLVPGSLTTESQLFSVPWTLQHCRPSAHFNEAPWDLLLAKFQPLSSHAPTLVAPSGRFPPRPVSLLMLFWAGLLLYSGPSQLLLLLLLSLTHGGLTATFQDADASPCLEHFSPTRVTCVRFDVLIAITAASKDKTREKFNKTKREGLVEKSVYGVVACLSYSWAIKPPAEASLYPAHWEPRLSELSTLIFPHLPSLPHWLQYGRCREGVSFPRPPPSLSYYCTVAKVESCKSSWQQWLNQHSLWIPLRCKPAFKEEKCFHL